MPLRCSSVRIFPSASFSSMKTCASSVETQGAAREEPLEERALVLVVHAARAREHFLRVVHEVPLASLREHALPRARHRRARRARRRVVASTRARAAWPRRAHEAVAAEDRPPRRRREGHAGGLAALGAGVSVRVPEGVEDGKAVMVGCVKRDVRWMIWDSGARGWARRRQRRATRRSAATRWARASRGARGRRARAPKGAPPSAASASRA